MPVYNAEETLSEAIDSVLGQSLRDLELICVDDGSEDRSLEILHDYERRDPRVRVYTQKNLFAGIARNNGLEKAGGEYIHFLDADDRVLPYAYECLYDKAKKYDLDVLRCAAVDWDAGQKCFVDKPRNSLSKLRPGDFNRLAGLEKGSPMYRTAVSPWAGLFRREFLLEHEIRFNDLRCVNDRSFYAAAITNASRMMLCRDRVIFHRDNQEGSLVGGRARHFDCHFRSVEIIAARLESDGAEPEIRERILGQEFDDLFVWYRRLVDGSELEESIEKQTADFVGSYEGACADLLEKKYQEAEKKLARQKITGREPDKKVAVTHEECASPKVSVAVPIYNVENYLNEALDSLSSQTLEEMEFLCVNDGSTDGSLAILKEYAALDKRIRVFDGPNGGYGKAMNRAIDAAHGEYLGILEPDDFVPHNMFGDLYETALENRADFVKADFYRFKVNPDGSLQKKKYKIAGGGIQNKGYYNRVLCPGDEQQTFRFVMNIWSGIYNLEFINRWHIRHNETPGASYQDNGFFFQTFCRAERALFVDKPYYMNRRDNPNSSMSNRGKLYCVTEEYAFIEKWLKKDPNLWDRYSRIFYAKKFSNFLVTYRRIAPELQQEYLRHIRDEFKGPLDGGLVGEEFLTEGQSWRLHKITEDPDAFYEHICVSVVMPVYNGEAYLREALDCVLTGSALQIEVICVDDGSTDGTPEILKEYAERDPRVRPVRQENAGAGAARNTGLKIARGEYLSFLDADDLFEPMMLEKAYDRARSQEADLVVFRCDKYMEETGKYLPTKWSMRESLLPGKDVFAGSEIRENVFKAFVGWTWDKLFRAGFVRENGLHFQEQRTTNDMFFTYSAVVRAERITTMQDVLVHRRMYTGSLSTTRSRSWRCFYDALCALRKQLQDWGMFEQRERDFANYSLNFSLWQLDTLEGDAYDQLYEQLKGEWLENLGVTGRSAGYFYDRDEYRQLKKLFSSTPEEFRTWKGERKGKKQSLRRAYLSVKELPGKVRKLAGKGKRFLKRMISRKK